MSAETTPPIPSPTPRPRPARIVSPEIHPNATVTFRLRAPEAKIINVLGEWDGPDDEMVQDENGVWSVTVGPLAPGIYGYAFGVDGIPMVDPSNVWTKPSRSTATSTLEIPHPEGAETDWRPEVPHGAVHLHDYQSQSLGYRRRLRVYTPAEYEANPETSYPVLYLLHGSGDNEAVWTEFGRANLILDNLIAAEQATPMILVMPDGHATDPGAPGSWGRNAGDFEADLLGDVMPFVEGRYRIEAHPLFRAIAGLSMGGNQSLRAGLNHRDLFAWIGAMSSAIREPESVLAAFWEDPFAVATPVHLLWIAVGRDDFLIEENRRFDALLTERGVPHQYVETGGGHQWMVWRRYLAEFARILFAVCA